MKAITGASGRIGGVLAQALAEQDGNHSVRAIDLERRGWAAKLDIEWVKRRHS